MLFLRKSEARDSLDEIVRAIDAAKTDPKPQLEDLTPVVEQEFDPYVLQETKYDIWFYDGKSVTRAYYDDRDDVEVYKNTGTYQTVVEVESETLERAQEVATEAYEARTSNHTFVVLDCRDKDARDSIKLFSPALWTVLNEMPGKIVFN